MSIIEQSQTFQTLQEYRNVALGEGDRVEVEYLSPRSSGPVTLTATIDRIEDEEPPYRLWLDVPNRESDYILSLYHGKSSVSFRPPGCDGEMRKANLGHVSPTCTVLERAEE